MKIPSTYIISITWASKEGFYPRKWRLLHETKASGLKTFIASIILFFIYDQIYKKKTNS
jgi:hypothetical protein